jgi:hypothetical protein
MLGSSLERRSEEMRLELGSRVDCADGRYGKLLGVVIEPTSRRVTPLMVEPRRLPQTVEHGIAHR